MVDRRKAVSGLASLDDKFILSAVAKAASGLNSPVPQGQLHVDSRIISSTW